MESAELTEAIDALYDAFAGYERPATFLACGCCWSGREVPGKHWNSTKRPLVEIDSPGGARPLRELAPDAALAEIGVDVPLTGGDLALFKHYLPRLCEIVTGTGFEDDWPDLSLITDHLGLGADVGGEPWWTWPADEQSAVKRFLEVTRAFEREATP